MVQPKLYGFYSAQKETTYYFRSREAAKEFGQLSKNGVIDTLEFLAVVVDRRPKELRDGEIIILGDEEQV